MEEQEQTSQFEATAELEHSAETSTITLAENLVALKQRKAELSSEIHRLKNVILGDSVNPWGERLLSLSQTLQALERQESAYQSFCALETSKLQAKINELEMDKDDKLSNHLKINELEMDKDDKLSNHLDISLNEADEKLNLAKKELAAKLNIAVALRRQVDNVASHAELIQYECRFSELNTHIEGKHRQTHKYYATYNALLEVKELMLKETSLLNSLSSQLQVAIASPAGQKKLIESLEGVLQGTQQKLDKMLLSLRLEQEIRDSLKEKCAAAIAEKRQSYSLLKAFQEECARNERLRLQISGLSPM